MSIRVARNSRSSRGWARARRQSGHEAIEQILRDERSSTLDAAECGRLPELLGNLGGHLERFLRFEHGDAMQRADEWRRQLDGDLPRTGIGIEALVRELGEVVVANGSPIPNPASSAFITTGATSAGALATLAGSVASPQRLGLTAFNLLEEVSLRWLAELFCLDGMKGVYSSGGSTANLVALGAARQAAFESIGVDAASEGAHRPCRLYGTAASHHTIRRAAAVLGLGRQSFVTVASDAMGRMNPKALEEQLVEDLEQGFLPVAVCANAGTTSAGAIDPLRSLGTIARRYGVWFHVDGAYGLPGIVDPELRPLYDGIELADSAIVDPHKWLGAPVGIGATFVRDRALLHRAFTQEPADYLEGSVTADAQSSMDGLGIPYHDFGVELSAPARGAVVWALLREIGVDGLRSRIRRHVGMARYVADLARVHPHLEVVQAPTLSIVCFRYVSDSTEDLNELNRRIHRSMIRRGRSMPSVASIDGVLALRPCFVGARASWIHADELVREVIEVGRHEVEQLKTEKEKE